MCLGWHNQFSVKINQTEETFYINDIDFAYLQFYLTALRFRLKNQASFKKDFNDTLKVNKVESCVKL